METNEPTQRERYQEVEKTLVKLVEEIEELYLCTFWLSRLKQRKAHIRSRVGRQIGTVHEAKPGRCVDGGAGFRVAPRQSSRDVATLFAGGLALPPGRHKPAAPADSKRRMAVAFIS